MDRVSESHAALALQWCIFFGGLAAIWKKPKARPEKEESNQNIANWMRSHYTPVVAGALAYACYVLADLMAYAPFPQFLRDHLFDGLAPAALVAILFDLYPEDLTDAFPKIRRPILIALIFFVSGAMIFGLIAAAAVFGSGETDYAYPILYVALTGGFIFSWAYMQQIIATHQEQAWRTSRTRRNPAELPPRPPDDPS